ncbi:hypothetical protein DPMN_056709 [Dreissena polymorpha]|uniref:Uncharacterized protein n=1 Tax=Dreissena polymorpha TaxID=45954 RepID=A0A9D4CU67_DREPO|nr:hypothetical protein DPMN_056709 [Dreissena polymorpha]
MSHYNLHSRQSATLPTHLTPPESPNDDNSNYTTVLLDQLPQPPTQATLKETPKLTSRHLSHRANSKQTRYDRQAISKPRKLRKQEVDTT